MDVRGRMGTPYYLQGLPTPEEGPTSSYWRGAEETYDLRLMDDDGNLRHEWRSFILDTLYGFWAQKGYMTPEAWSTVWIAGSAITKQWRKPDNFGDLDVLIGVNIPKFISMNPKFSGFSEKMISNHFNAQFREELHPQTGNVNDFEVTFYVNEGSADIRDINPYAAYNVSEDEWTVDPIEMPTDYNPDEAIPQEWWDAIQREIDQAKEYYELVTGLLADAQRYPPGDPHWTSLNALIRRTSKAAADLFGSIHQERQKAFAGGGEGYLDFYNFRWQAHKRFGTTKFLHYVKSQLKEVEQDTEALTYGYEIKQPEAALQEAMWAQNKEWG